jgi:hypothetical protein
MDKKLEFNTNLFELNQIYSESVIANGLGMRTPDIDDNYWLYRVALSENQAIVCFPKFGTLGVGFEKEIDWNINLPYTEDTLYIFEHIKGNKQEDTISDEDCIEAIKMIQEACREYVGKQKKVYVKKWDVPSSGGSRTYKVSLTNNGDFECSCPAWTTHTPRKNCKHITGVRNGEYDGDNSVRYELIPASVGAVEKKSETTFYVPLIPLNDDGTDILATMIYDLLSYGVPWVQIKEVYGRMIGKTWTKPAVIAHVERNGRAVYSRFQKGYGWIELKHIPVVS